MFVTIAGQLGIWMAAIGRRQAVGQSQGNVANVVTRQTTSCWSVYDPAAASAFRNLYLYQYQTRKRGRKRVTRGGGIDRYATLSSKMEGEGGGGGGGGNSQR